MSKHVTAGVCDSTGRELILTSITFLNILVSPGTQLSILIKSVVDLHKKTINDNSSKTNLKDSSAGDGEVNPT